MHGIVDVHCHILPGVDDGADTDRMAIDMIRTEKQQGVDGIILTPHYHKGIFETDQTLIRRRFERLIELNDKAKTGVALYLGCEFRRMSDMIRILENAERPSLADSKYILVEFSSRDDYERIRKTIYELLVHNWIPVIAHGERYPSLVEDLDRVEDVLRLGAKLQITSGAVYGNHGFRYKKICKKLLAEDMVDFIATDAHDLRKRAPDFDRCVQYIEKKKGPAYARRILVDNPGMLLAKRV